jgi:multicomponent Na+:H+ antiporter subunit D
MEKLAPLAVAGPFLIAALFAISMPLSRRRDDIVSIVTASAGVVFVGAMLIDVLSRDVPVVTWVGGWQPRAGVALGISMAFDPLSTSLALLAAVLVCAAFLFAWRYFETPGPIFHALMLVFGGAMAGFCLSGDLFNLFVFFELMSVTAYALTAYRSEESGPLQGALTFAVSNTVGAVFILFGIALLYARTGALNLAQIGVALAHGHADGLVVGAFAFLCIGFMVKAAVVPFHFWLADAYAVAPTPACVIFSGVMSDLGIYAIARVYWTMFDGPFHAHLETLRLVFLLFGGVTALWGAVLCLAQHHLKRLLAFVTISQIGMALIGVGLFSTEGIAAAALLIAADGLLRAGLFVAIGAVIHRTGSVNELRLYRLGRQVPRPLAAIFFAGALGLAGPPFLGAFSGKRVLEHAAIDVGHGWIIVVFVVAAILTAAAVLRAGGRVFLGWGAPAEDDPIPFGRPTGSEVERDDDEAEAETTGAPDTTPPVMIATAGALVAGGLAISLFPALVDKTLDAAARFTDRAAYAAVVLHGAKLPLPDTPNLGVDALAILFGLLSVGGAVGIALAVLSPRHRVRELVPLRLRGPLRGTYWAVRRLHSGQAGDYVTWLSVGAATFGVLLAAATR